MTNPNKQENQDDLYCIAADWHTRMDDPNTGALDRAQLDVWLSEDPEHAAAYKAIERMWDTTRRMATDPRILKFRHEALSAASSPSPRARKGGQGVRLSFSPIHVVRLRFLATAAAIVIVIGAAVIALPLLHEYGLAGKPSVAGQKLDAGIFTTAVGERSSITLSDGSFIVLDTQSRIDVTYSPEQRRIRLVSGQAWFQVAHNPTWPFVVDAGDRRITALGTAFDVRLGSGEKKVQVTLVEGRVTVEAIRSPLARLIRSAPPASVLMPGDSLVVSDAEPVLSRQADVAKIASWRQGQLVFEGDTLDAAIAEVNRYSNTQIVLADPALANLRVSGVFKVGHNRSFIETVTAHFQIVASAGADGRVVLAPKPPAVSR
jgi:transmembrane sensor